jgi:hypothetical protein
MELVLNYRKVSRWTHHRPTPRLVARSGRDLAMHFTRFLADPSSIPQAAAAVLSDTNSLRAGADSEGMAAPARVATMFAALAMQAAYSS